MSQLSLFLLGSPRFQLNDKAVAIGRSKATALLVYLAVTRQQHNRSELATLLWPEYAPGQSTSYLRQALWTLTKVLGREWVDVDRYSVGLAARPELWVDVHEYYARLQPVRNQGVTSVLLAPDMLPALQEAASMYNGNFLTGFSLVECAVFEEWQLLQSEELKRLQTLTLDRLARYFEAAGKLETAIDYGRQLLRLDTLNETVHRQLMEWYLQMGRPSLALYQYQECSQILRKELNVAPAPETTKLYEKIKNHEIGTPSPASRQPVMVSTVPIHIPQPGVSGSLGQPPNEQPIASAPSPVAQLTASASVSPLLPTQMTPFVGREVELVKLEQQLPDPTCRLLTLIGPGGIGKTRLAIQLAENLHNGFADGVYFIPLAGLASPDFLVSAIANHVGFSFYRQDETPAVQLLSFLSQKNMLLVLDNLEHLLEGAGLVEKIVKQAPQIKLVVTSREHLNLHGEWLFEVRGLGFPTEEQVAVTQPSAEQLSRNATYGAVQLFVQSARRVDTNFVLDADVLPAILRICRLVEGMPLALELAAAWVRLFSCQAIVDELEQNLALLSTTARNVPDRHRSIQSIFAQSWTQLDAPTQVVLQKLSVFRAGFGRVSAQAVAGSSLPILGELHDKSLVRKDGKDRYSIHELLRQFAAEKLNTTPALAEQAHNAHCQTYLAYLHECGTQLFSRIQKQIIVEIKTDLENIRFAWHWAVEHKKVALLSLVLDDLTNVYEICSWFHEGYQLFTHAVSHFQTEGDEETQNLQAKLLARLGFFSHRLGNYERAKVLVEQSLTMPYHQSASNGRAYCLVNLSEIVRIQGNYTQAQQYLEESLAICRAIQEHPLLGKTLNMLGIVWGVQGDFGRARPLFQEAIMIFERLEDQTGKVLVLNNLGLVCALEQDYAAARQFYQASIPAAMELGSHYRVASALNNLGIVAFKQGNHEESLTLQQESLGLYRKIGYRMGVGIALIDLGMALLALGNTQDAEQAFQEALDQSQKIKAIPLALAALSGLAFFHAQLGNADLALKLATIVDVHPASEHARKQRVAPLFTELAATLSPATIEQVRQSTSPDDLAAVILAVQVQAVALSR